MRLATSVNILSGGAVDVDLCSASVNARFARRVVSISSVAVRRLPVRRSSLGVNQSRRDEKGGAHIQERHPSSFLGFNAGLALSGSDHDESEYLIGRKIRRMTCLPAHSRRLVDLNELPRRCKESESVSMQI